MGLTISTVSAPRPTVFEPPPVSLTGVVRPSRNDPREREIAKELRHRFQEWQSADHEWLSNARFEFDFLDNHWIEEETGRERQRDMEEIGRAAFNIDMLNPAIDLTVNQARISKITANFIPLSEGADQATADIRQGLYRNIERVSKGSIARETAYQMAVSVGRGYERVIIEDEPGPTFQKRIGLQRVDNIESIAIDPTCLDFNYSDAAWGYAFEDVWKDEFRETYGDSVDDLDLNGMELTDATRDLWFPKDKVRVGEYWRKVWKRREVWRLEDGTQCWKENAPPGSRLANDGKPNIRSKMDYTFEWRKMTGTQTIEKMPYPGLYVPIVVFIGREVFRGRKPKIHRGMIRPAIAPSRIYDVMYSRMVDAVGLSPLPHMFAAEGQLAPEQERKVNEINRHTWSVITYTVKTDAEGRALAAPHWESPATNVAAIVQAAEMAAQNLDRVLNTYAPNRGQAIADQSGRAIREIKDSGDIAHASLPDNFNRAVVHEATIINDLMDYVYSDEQAITITHPDETTTRVLINQEYMDEKTGKKKKHMFGGKDKYGVSITAGPSYPSRMAEAGQKLLDLAKIFPGPISKVLYLLVDDLGLPNASKYKEVLAPAGVKEGGEGPNQQQLSMQVQHQEQTLQQADKIIQTLMQKVQQLGDVNLTKRMEIASRERIAAAGDRATVIGAELKYGHEAAMAVMQARFEEIARLLESGDTQVPADNASSSSGQADQQAVPTQEPAPAAPMSPVAPGSQL